MEIALQKNTSMVEGMRRMASGVCIITTKSRSGQFLAMTASSVTSLSADPPSLLVCINARSRFGSAIMDSENFCVNVLSFQHETLSNLCASPSSDHERFESSSWTEAGGSGLLYLSDAEAAFFCARQAVYRYGTHNIVIGNIQKTLVSTGRVDALTYLNGGYYRLSEQ